MYAGHAGVALALKAYEPRVPLAPLVVACYGPDWFEMAAALHSGRATMDAVSHSIPAVLLGGLAGAGLYALLLRRPGAWMIFLGWLLHWPADFLTATKPLFDIHHLVGLDLYHRPAIDFLLEGAVITGGCVLYARRIARERVQRRWVFVMGVLLVAMQFVLDFGLRSEQARWQPSLVTTPRRSHPGRTACAGVGRRPACLLHSPAASSDASVQWQREAPGA